MCLISREGKDFWVAKMVKISAAVSPDAVHLEGGASLLFSDTYNDCL